jgi:hypothetical protein
MLRGLGSVAIGLALASAGAASAATSSSQTMGVSGGAPEICTVQNPVIAGGALLNFRSLNGTTLQIDQLADSKTLASMAATADVTMAAVCNFPHRIRLESQNNGLWRGGAAGAPPPTGFADGVPYTATLEWGPANTTFFVDAQSRRLSQQITAIDQAVAGDIKIHLAIQAGASNLGANSPLIAGTYSDTLRVTVEPQ